MAKTDTFPRHKVFCKFLRYSYRNLYAAMAARLCASLLVTGGRFIQHVCRQSLRKKAVHIRNSARFRLELHKAQEKNNI